MTDTTDTARSAQGRRLGRAALAYLERYASSEANLRRVLAAKLRRWQAADGVAMEAEAAAGLVDAAVAECRALGLIDDRAYAETKVASGRRKGLSARRIGAGLAAKGVGRDTAAAALAVEGMDDERAALRFAQRKRLGPFRLKPAADPREADRRDLAALCRAGHPFAAARRVLAFDRDTAEARLAGDDG